MTVESLRSCGVKVDEGLSRCMNNEAFYLRLVGMALEDAGFEKLRAAVEKGDLQAGFEAAHALKGVLGNLSLTPIYEPVSEITELLRAKTGTDYAPLLKQVADAREMLRNL